MPQITDRELFDAIRTICTSPSFTDSDQRIRVILATLDVHRPATVSPAAADEDGAR